VLYLIVLLLVSFLGVVFFLKSKKQTQIAQPTEKTLPLEDLSQKAPAEKVEVLASEIEIEKIETAKVETKKESITEAPEELVSLKEALKNTEKSFFGRIKSLFSNEEQAANFDEVEEVLYTSDLGPQTVQRLMTAVEKNLSRTEKSKIETIKSTLREEMLSIFNKSLGNLVSESDLLKRLSFSQSESIPSVWMIVGVNGAGKTTSIGKLAHMLAQSQKKVLIAAGDTFRAAAGGQLKVWADRAQVDIFSPEGVTDPSAVAFDALSKAKAGGYDVVIIDTAGRLHTQANLMEEIKKVKRVMQKIVPESPHETLIVLDANQGQNALQQAKEFHQALGLTGVILTKLDGTAKGGVAVGVAYEVDLPIKLIGVGEKIQDLRSFSPEEFVDSILY
jgi:fused signal recognition particle receptor